MSTEELVHDTGIPSQRLSAKYHLQRAAKSELASDTEHYHLQAAIGEGLLALDKSIRELIREVRYGQEHQGPPRLPERPEQDRPAAGDQQGQGGGDPGVVVT